MAAFTHDVFVSHSLADKPVVRELAVRLRDRGLRVWFDEWEIEPGDSIAARVEDGLEGSAVLLLCMSANAFGSDWARLESGTFRFRDPLNRDRRFIPVRLDDTPAPGSLGQFLYVDWRERDDGELDKLVTACAGARPQRRLGDENPAPVQVAGRDTAHVGGAGRPGPAEGVPPAGPNASAARSISLGHTGPVYAVAVAPDGATAVSGSGDATVRVWELASGECLRVLEGHTDWVRAVAVGPDGTTAVSGADDRTVRVWDLASGECRRVLEGHTNEVNAVAVAPDGATAVSGSDDGTVRVWDLASGQCLRVLDGYSGPVTGVAFLPDGSSVLSVAANGVMRLWSPGPGAAVEAQVAYPNAKVVLVGEHAAGKTGLALRLAHDRWEETTSTLGAWATQLRLPGAAEDGTEREVWLWDFGGQADQRLVHQLFLNDASVAVFVYDGNRDDALPRLWDWSRSMRSAAPGATRLLAAGRVDENPVRISETKLAELADADGFGARFQTSAKADLDCTELRAAILAGIDWERVPRHTSPVVFKRIKDAVLRL
jgi:GTPase SAR1 family protein